MGPILFGMEWRKNRATLNRGKPEVRKALPRCVLARNASRIVVYLPRLLSIHPQAPDGQFYPVYCKQLASDSRHSFKTVTENVNPLQNTLGAYT